MRWRAKPLICFWLNFVVFVSSHSWISGLASHLIFHRFSPFNCCLSVVLLLDKKKKITPKIRMLCFVLIHSILFNLLCVWTRYIYSTIYFSWHASKHKVHKRYNYYISPGKREKHKVHKLYHQYTSPSVRVNTVSISSTISTLHLAFE